VMMDVGYGADDPALMLTHWKFYLRSITNAIIDAKIHTAGMTEAEAVSFMVEGGFQEEAEARAKYDRARLSSTQLSTYFAGSLEMWAIEQEVRRRAAIASGDPRGAAAVPEPRVVGGFGERAVDVAPVVDALPALVASDLFVDHGRARVERGAGIDHRVEHLVLDLDQLGGVARGPTSGGDDWMSGAQAASSGCSSAASVVSRRIHVPRPGDSARGKRNARPTEVCWIGASSERICSNGVGSSGRFVSATIGSSSATASASSSARRRASGTSCR